MSSVSNRPSINVHTSTLQEAQDFLSKAADGNKKIYGRQDGKTGEITLYAKSGTSARQVVRDRIGQAFAKLRGGADSSSHFASKQAAGREGVRQFLGRIGDPDGFKGSRTLAQKGEKALFASLQERVSGEAGSLKAAEFRATVGGFDRLGKLREIIGALHAISSEPPGAKLSDVRGNAFHDGISKAFTDIRTGQTPSPVSLGAAIAKGLAANYTARGDRFSLMLRDLDGLKQGVARELREQLDLGEPGHGTPDAVITALAEAAVEMARNEVCGASAEPGPTRTITGQNVTDFETGKTVAQPFDLPDVTVNGKTYRPTRYVSSGGFGHVVEFRDANGAKLAMKIPKFFNGDGVEVQRPTQEETARARNAARAEIASHLAAQGAGDPNVLNLRGAVELPGGNIGILLDYADGGTASDLEAALNSPAIRAGANDAPASGQITDADVETISLTLAHDMLSGLRHLHDTQNVTSLDSKYANALMIRDGQDANGIPKLKTVLCDFGTAIEGTRSLPLTRTPHIGNFAYVAPELQTAQVEREAAQSGARRAANEQLRQHFGGRLGDQEKDMLVENIAIADGTSNARGTIDAKVDIWGVGVSLVNLIGNQDLRNPDDLAAFKDSASDAVQPGIVGANGATSVAPGALFTSLPASQATTRFVNDLLKGSADQRLDAFGALAHPALRQPGVGSDAARALSGAVTEMRSALASGDQGRIATAKQNVDLARAALDQTRQAAAVRAAQPFVPPVIRTSVSLPSSPVSIAQAQGSGPSSSLRPEIDAFFDAVASKDEAAIAASSKALGDGINRTKGAPPTVSKPNG